MPININDVNQQLNDAGSAIDIGFERTSPTTGVISWDIPNPIGAYDGILVLMKPSSDIGLHEFPQDGVRYYGSPDMGAVADRIGDAYVVAAIYGDKLTTSVNVIGLDPNMVYFVSGHVVDNVMRYNTEGNYAYNTVTKTDTFTGFIKKLPTPPNNPIEGSVYYNTSVGTTFLFDGDEWIPCTRGRKGLHGDSTTTTTGDVNGVSGRVNDEFRIAYDTDRTFPDTSAGYDAGRFFYHLVQNRLFAWTGTKWVQANSDYEGVPMYLAPGVGTDGTSDEFESMANVLKRKLGWPQMCVELNDTDFNNAINEAISMARRRMDNAYTQKFIMLQAKQGQAIYYLNDPANETDTIVDVIKINRSGALGITMFNNGDVYMQQLLNDLTAKGSVDLTTIHAITEYSELFERIFATDIGFIWNEAKRQLTLLKRLTRDDVLLLECACERTAQEMLQDRWLSDWLEDWAMAECKAKLGMIRTKYGTLPGPGGGITLNGAELTQQATEEFAELLRQVNDLEVGNGGAFGCTGFLIG